MKYAYGAVNRNLTAMRRHPDSESEQISQAIFGEMVRVLRSDGEYCEVQSPDGYQGWLKSAHITILETGERYPAALPAMITSLFAPLYAQPSAQSDRLTLLTLGTAVELSAGDPGAEFYAVRVPDGTLGYVEAASLIVPTYPDRAHLGRQLVTVSRAFIGVPYLWGGRTPFGLDCSGFTQRLYWLCGHSLPRDAFMQAAFSGFDAADTAALEPGDLLFYSREPDSVPPRVTHVAMACDHETMIHAEGGSGVHLARREAPPWAQRFLFAKRLSKLSVSEA